MLNSAEEIIKYIGDAKTNTGKSLFKREKLTRSN